MAKIVCIARRLSGNIGENVRSILNICREIHRKDEDAIPFAPYLVSVHT